MISQYVLTKPSQPENVYGKFVYELLKAEGFNGFEVVNIEESGLPDFGAQDLVVLTRCFLRNVEMDTLVAAVERGTRLVCIRPQPRLAERLGWVATCTSTRNGWVRIGEGYPGSGIPIQTHVPIEFYRRDGLGEAQVVAFATDHTWREGGPPAVVRQKMGEGEIVLFFYDLPKAVARIRFGDPELASTLASGEETWNWQHALDLFGAGYLDERVRRLPQADFHAQLLGKMITDICPYPLPRLWYYEHATQRSAVVFTSDDDMSEPAQFEELSDCLFRHEGSASFYLMEETHLSHQEVAVLREKGNTVGAHINPNNSTEEWYFDFPRQVDRETALFKERFGRPSVSLQCHFAPWQGYMMWLPVFIRNGYRMLMAYLSNRINTFMCGSGRPLKFTDLHGTTHDCWQQPITTYDDETLRSQIEEDPQPLIREFTSLLTNAVETNHTTIGMLSHPVSFSTYSRPFMEPCMKLIRDAGVPIYNGDEWCAVQDRRYGVRIVPKEISGTKMVYAVENLKGSLSLMLPVDETTSGEPLVRVNGEKVAVSVSRRLEQEYCFVPLEVPEANFEVEIEVIHT